MQNFNSLHAEVHQLKKAENATLRPFINRCSLLQNALMNAFKAKFDGASVQAIKTNLINPDDYEHFKSFGLSAADLTRISELVNVDVRNDYKRLAELSSDTSRAEVSVMQARISELEREIEDHKYHHRMVLAACRLGPDAVTTLQQILETM